MVFSFACGSVTIDGHDTQNDAKQQDAVDTGEDLSRTQQYAPALFDAGLCSVADPMSLSVRPARSPEEAALWQALVKVLRLLAFTSAWHLVCTLAPSTAADRGTASLACPGCAVACDEHVHHCPLVDGVALCIFGHAIVGAD